ncbi:mg2+ transporter zinc transport protein [Stemphylium lycopersici]|nr:mg2+ transporter zinc transport protein [Stemphylium lycopersici]
MASEGTEPERSDRSRASSISVPPGSPKNGQTSHDMNNEKAERQPNPMMVHKRNSLLDKPKPEMCTSMPEQLKKDSHETHPYVSFGDHGTTASLNAFGDIIQISQAHRSARSGIVSVDLPEVPEPSSVQSRAQKLMSARESDGEGLLRDHKEPTKPETYSSVYLAVSIFVNGEPQELSIDGDDNVDNLRITAKSNPGFQVEPGRSLQTTVAYKILVREKSWDGTDFPITQNSLYSMHNMLSKFSFARLDMSPDENIDFIMRRNLEHILSVCSIPLPEPGQDPSDDQEPINEPIGLTCGDMSGHRIVTSASFNNIDRNTYVLHLRQRISQVCRGHIIWLMNADKVENRSENPDKTRLSFATNYWVTGKAISKDGPCVESLTDTPFQLIKFADYGRLFKMNENSWNVEKLKKQVEENSKSCEAIGSDIVEMEMKEVFKNLAQDWIRQLHAANARGFYAFSRPQSNSTRLREFRLEDHVWIWKALGALIDGIPDIESKKSKFGQNGFIQRKINSKSVIQDSDLMFKYAPKTFQKHVLRRFTTENPVSKQRMLAVARSPGENRFYLHSRDITLFYEENRKFFSMHTALWKTTMDIQKNHEESEDSGWSNPMRYILDIILGNSKDNMEAGRILLQSLSANGLFPGSLDPLTKEPALYDETWRDDYWHRTFEIPFLLWKNRDSELFRCIRCNDPAQTQKETSDVRTQPAKGSSATLLASDLFSTQMRMKKRMPFNNVILQKSIVELADEWLYELPEFFSPEVSNEGSIEDKDPNEADEGFIIDIPKTNQWNRNREYRDPLLEKSLWSNKAMSERLGELRTPGNSKKRLVWFKEIPKDVQSILKTQSLSQGSVSLDLSFKKHRNKVKYFSDEVTATANTWTTEFHLSSYRFCTVKSETSMNFLGNQKLFIERVGSGFRFVGDFFDRYWTCYVLETESGEKVNGRNDLKEILEPAKLEMASDGHKKPWKQRKVLELLLCGRMLKQLAQRYEGITYEIGKEMVNVLHATSQEEATSGEKATSGDQVKIKEVGKKEERVNKSIVSISNELFSMQMNNGAYSDLWTAWPAFQYSLQLLEEDLKDVLEKTEEWSNRKKEREPEEPRWTKNDERRYRAAITKLTIENSHAIRDLKDQARTIQSLRASISSGLDSARDELELQNADLIRSFTYLTAVFLPLGFATGIWSMADSSPRSESITGMVITAAVVLILTTAMFLKLPALNKFRNQHDSRAYWEWRNRQRNKARASNPKSTQQNSQADSHGQNLDRPPPQAGHRSESRLTNQAQQDSPPQNVRVSGRLNSIESLRRFLGLDSRSPIANDLSSA